MSKEKLHGHEGVLRTNEGQRAKLTEQISSEQEALRANEAEAETLVGQVDEAKLDESQKGIFASAKAWIREFKARRDFVRSHPKFVERVQGDVDRHERETNEDEDLRAILEKLPEIYREILDAPDTRDAFLELCEAKQLSRIQSRALWKNVVDHLYAGDESKQDLEAKIAKDLSVTHHAAHAVREKLAAILFDPAERALDEQQRILSRKFQARRRRRGSNDDYLPRTDGDTGFGEEEF